MLMGQSCDDEVKYMFADMSWNGNVPQQNKRGIEWSLRAFASMRAVCLFLRARAVNNFLMRAASTLEITNGEQRALRKFSAIWNLSILKTLFCAT